MTCCPTCGRQMPKAKAPKAAKTLPERHELDRLLAEGSIDRDAYYKACKAIAVRDDARFFLRVAGPISAELYAAAEALSVELERRPATASDAKALYAIKFAYRTDRARKERQTAVQAA